MPGHLLLSRVYVSLLFPLSYPLCTLFSWHFLSSRAYDSILFPFCYPLRIFPCSHLDFHHFPLRTLSFLFYITSTFLASTANSPLTFITSLELLFIINLFHFYIASALPLPSRSPSATTIPFFPSSHLDPLVLSITALRLLRRGLSNAPLSSLHLSLE